MTYSTAVPRRALRKGALGLGAVAVSLFASVGAASAHVYVVSPDGNTGADILSPTIAAANGNSDATNTIVLKPGRYTPAGVITITKNLTISGDHAAQAVTGAPATTIDGSNQASKAPGDEFTITQGANVRFDGFQMNSGGGSGFDVVHVNGPVKVGTTQYPGSTFTTWGLTFGGPVGGGIGVGAGGTVVLNETSLINSGQNQIQNVGNVTLNNSDILQGQTNAILNQGGTFTLNNSILAYQTGTECIGGTATGGGVGSFDDDGTCGVAHSNDANVDNWTNGIPQANGGPTLTVAPPAGDDTAGQGVNCPTVDQRFFANQGTACDSGAISDTAARDSTPPSCTVTNIAQNSSGQNTSETVTVTDSGAGMGPQTAPATDNPSNTNPLTIRPTSAIPLAGYNVDNLYIDNGTVTAAFPTAPSRTGENLTATKATLGNGNTHWNFTATDWAGNVQFCN